MKTIIGPDIEATPNIKGIACTPVLLTSTPKFAIPRTQLGPSAILQELEEGMFVSALLKPRTRSGDSCSCSTN